MCVLHPSYHKAYTELWQNFLTDLCNKTPLSFIYLFFFNKTNPNCAHILQALKMYMKKFVVQNLIGFIQAYSFSYPFGFILIFIIFFLFLFCFLNDQCYKFIFIQLSFPMLLSLWYHAHSLVGVLFQKCFQRHNLKMAIIPILIGYATQNSCCCQVSCNVDLYD